MSLDGNGYPRSLAEARKARRNAQGEAGRDPEQASPDAAPEAHASAAPERHRHVRRAARLCAQAVIQAFDEDVLFHAHCLELVEVGDYRRAWIVATDDPKTGTTESALRLRASTGPTDEEGRSARDAVEAAWQTATQALDSNRPRPARIALAPKTGPAREEMVCALPLRFGGHGHGVLVLHDAQSGGFRGEELPSLQAIAHRLEDGVCALRERRAAEADRVARRQQAKRSETLFAQATHGILVADPDGTITTVNDAFARLIGHDGPEALSSAGKVHLADLMETTEWDRLVEAIDRDEPSPARELVLRRRDGSRIWVTMNAMRISSQGRPLVAFVQDITTMRSERETRRWLAAIASASAAAVFSKDPDGTIQTWNRGAALLYGFTPEEAIGKRAADLIIPEGYKDEEFRNLARVRRGESVPVFETQRRRKDGSTFDAAVSMSPIRNAAGETTHIAVVAHDVSGRAHERQMQLSLERQETEARRLKTLAQARRDFINEAAHELKTPLTPILTHLHVLKGEDLHDEEEESIRILERNADRMAQLVNDLVDASRLTAERLPIDPRPTEMRRLVRDVVDSFRETARRGGLRLEAEALASAIIDVDRARLTQVLFNLLSNAIRFTPTGGTVRVVLHEEPEGAVVRVEDTGPGLEARELAQLFEPFKVFHTHGKSGSGLGLFISKGIVEAHGGTMWAESGGPGRGLTIALRVPHPDARGRTDARGTAFRRPFADRDERPLDATEQASDGAEAGDPMEGRERTTAPRREKRDEGGR